MAEAILFHGTFKVCFWSLQKTKYRTRSSWYDPENDDNFPKIPAGFFCQNRIYETVKLWDKFTPK